MTVVFPEHQGRPHPASHFAELIPRLEGTNPGRRNAGIQPLVRLGHAPIACQRVRVLVDRNATLHGIVPDADGLLVALRVKLRERITEQEQHRANALE